jgi:predicted 2-oxoglutarate/Fe(II)-dependent dioxygenase YbiX
LLQSLFFRKYDMAHRKDLAVHTDVHAYTANILVSPRSEFKGADLVAVKADAPTPEPVDYGPGDVVLHDSHFAHGVSPLEEGTRVTLIMFWDMPGAVPREGKAMRFVS